MLDDVVPIIIGLSLVLIIVVGPLFVTIRLTRRLSPGHRILRATIVSLATLVIVLVLSTYFSPLELTKSDTPWHVPPPSQPPPEDSLPPFPWPPPRPSTRVLIPPTAFGACKNFGQLSYALDQALMQTGYVDKSYYAVPGGIGVITRLERIYPDGHSFEAPSRWVLEDTYPQLSLRSYLRALFTASEGYYRVIVFAVTDVPFGSGERPMTSEDATNFLARGYNTLPEQVSARLLPAHYVCTSLIYEFQREQSKAPTQLLPGHLDAKTHLVASGLWSALGLNR